MAEDRAEEEVLVEEGEEQQQLGVEEELVEQEGEVRELLKSPGCLLFLLND